MYKSLVAGIKEGSFWARSKDGHSFPVEISLSHFYDRKRFTVIAFMVDATEKKQNQALIEASFSNIQHYNQKLEEQVQQRTNELEQANQELKKGQSLYKAMAQNFPDGIIGVLDRNLKYLLVDGKNIRLVGLNEETVIGDRIFDDIHSLISIQAEKALKKVYLGENISFDVELQDKIYNITSVPIPGTGKEIAEILVVIKNISEQKKLEKELVKTLEKERELNFLKTRFVTIASHEFRTPLTTILSSAYLLEHFGGEQLEREKKKHLGRITLAVHGMTELLNDFLLVGKLEEEKVKATYKEFHLMQFMKDLLQELEMVKKEGQKLNLFFDVVPSLVLLDQQLLKSILMNLLSNAIKYSPVGERIQISVEKHNDEIIFEIQDKGIGIPKEEQKYIFKRFFRAHNTTDIQGTGLGLNIANKYVKLLKGSIAFTSSLNQGTTFTVNVPLKFNKQKKITKTIIP